MNKLPILFVRYAPGSAGNFFISLLQTSNRISCWDMQVENSKGTLQLESNFKAWFERCFQPDLNNHLKYEPHHPYDLDFFSSKHSRGDELTVDEFMNNLQQRNDNIFLDNIKKDFFTVIRLNKSIVPCFGQGNTVVNIVVDKPARKWFYKTRMIKLFGIEDQQWISKENHPEFLNAKYNKIMFNNQYKFAISKFSFLKNFVIDEPAIRPFFSESTIVEHVSNQTSQQLFINLSVIFNEETFISTMADTFSKLNLGGPDLDLLKWAYKHYSCYNIDPFK
jgi:hypothetical protein